MLTTRQNQNCHCANSLPARKIAAAWVIAAVLIVCGTSSALAQTFTVIHSFTGGADGNTPLAGLTLDRAGNLYGTTIVGGQFGNGVVFRVAKKNGQWTFLPIYSFRGGTSDGRYPSAAVTIGPDGSIYGTTALGGLRDAGIIFKLQPPPGICKSLLCPWRETVLHSFNPSCPPCDGTDPYSRLVFDQAGNLYGTTFEGGTQGGGTVFELTPAGTETVLYNFGPFPDGEFPLSGVVFDSSGNLYGTTSEGGASDNGAVYRLAPSGGGWIETILHSLSQEEGSVVQAGLVRDASGNLFGAASQTGAYGYGSIFDLVPAGSGEWNFNVIYSLLPQSANQPLGALTFDSHENLYGVGYTGGRDGFGEVFKLTHEQGNWIYSYVYDFTGGRDGGNSYGDLVVDAAGNLYGTTTIGGGPCGPFGCGVVWTISTN
jgi:uncharacterized repeat protein (TIGR03803 family)